MTIAPPAELLASYRRVPGSYDEMFTPDGQAREHWAHAGNVIGNLGLEELLHRSSEARRLLDDDGVTYNVYGQEGLGDAGTPAAAPWALDPVPVLLASQEWAGVELGVIQRAELLNLVLTDLYGPRDLLRRGVLPAELVFGHSGFLRQCDQIRLPGNQQLFNMAVDLVRDASGEFSVLADFTQAPSGAGYALENRVVVSRVFPSLYRDSQVHRLAPFFRTLRSSLQDVAPPDADDPRIVLLSPGPWSETAFEHAYLASHLGYALVEGADLTVREGRVWMRSLRNLERVDVILRRTDAWFCDPLELRADSRLGVPGLVEVARVGGVSIVNTLGSGVLENPGLLPYLPRLAQHLLGEQLLMPSVPTWWCGDEDGRRHVLANLERLVVKPITRRSGPTAVFPWELTNELRDDLRAQDRSSPSRLGRPGAPPAGIDAHSDCHRSRGQAERAACLRRGPPGLLRRDAWRFDAGRRARGRFGGRPGSRAQPEDLEPGRRDQQGHLGARLRARKAFRVLAGLWSSGDRRRPGGVNVVPGRREPVLDGPLCRAGRGSCPSGAGGPRPAQRFPAQCQPRRY
jgi:uncharacterized circularly permuted ATP-grasp superfamily protein